MTTLNKSDLQKFSEQSGLQVDGRSEFAYTDRLEHFSRLVRLDLELEIDDLKDQLAKAEQLWQIAQGRCDGLEEKLAKAEQRVAEWQPIETALKQQRDELLAAAEAIEIDAEECLDFDECTAMLVPIDTYHKLMEAIASVKGGSE